MPIKGRIFLLLVIISIFMTGLSCRTREAGTITIAQEFKFSGLDTLSTTVADSAADRIRNLIFNSLVKKNDKFEYVGELAKDIKIDADSLTITFNLQKNVTFHNGKIFTSADAKYTLEALFESGSYKGASFYDTVDGQKQPHITSIEPVCN